MWFCAFLFFRIQMEFVDSTIVVRSKSYFNQREMNFVKEWRFSVCWRSQHRIGRIWGLTFYFFIEIDGVSVLWFFWVFIWGILASKVERRDSLAKFLSNRPAKVDLIQRNIIPIKSDAERLEDRNIIGRKLNRSQSTHLSLEEMGQSRS